MELKDLRCFVAVAEELHFGRAAARLHISAPPLTQRIKQLERELGVLLFHRTKRSVAISAAGAALLDEARLLLLHADSLVTTVHRAARGDAGHLRAGLIGSAVFLQGRNLQTEISRKLPGVRLVWHELSSVDQIQAIRQRRLDLGLVNTPIAHEGIALGFPIREPLAVAVPASHPLAKRTSVPLRNLRNEVFVLGARHLSPGFYDRIISACDAAGFSPTIDHQAGHMLTYLSLVAIGAGVSLVPSSMANAGLAGVRFLRIQGTAPYAEISLAWNPDDKSPMLARVLELFRLHVQRAPSSARHASSRGATHRRAGAQ